MEDMKFSKNAELHHSSEANGRVLHRKNFANTYSTNIVKGAGHSWNPGYSWTFRGMVGQ